MAASDEYPRGWDITVTASSGALTANVPLAAGITHVLTSANLSGYIDNLAAPTGDALTLTSAGFTLTLLELIIQAVAAGVYNPLTGAWTGKVAGVPGAGLSVTTGVQGTGSFWALEIQGYDI